MTTWDGGSYQLTRVHVTRVSDGRVYGHATDYCDATGCIGAEQPWPSLDGMADRYSAGDTAVAQEDL